MRLKHPHFVRTMMGLQNSDSLLAIHGRSVAAYLNNCMKTSYPVPTLSVSEARAKLGTFNEFEMKTFKVKKILVVHIRSSQEFAPLLAM